MGMVYQKLFEVMHIICLDDKSHALRGFFIFDTPCSAVMQLTICKIYNKLRLFNAITFKQDATSFIRDWTVALSYNNFQEACDLLDIPDNEDEYIIWNKDVLEEIFSEYGHGKMPVINNHYG